MKPGHVYYHPRRCYRSVSPKGQVRLAHVFVATFLSCDPVIFQVVMNGFLGQFLSSALNNTQFILLFVLQYLYKRVEPLCKPFLVSAPCYVMRTGFDGDASWLLGHELASLSVTPIVTLSSCLSRTSCVPAVTRTYCCQCDLNIITTTYRTCVDAEEF